MDRAELSGQCFVLVLARTDPGECGGVEKWREGEGKELTCTLPILRMYLQMGCGVNRVKMVVVSGEGGGFHIVHPAHIDIAPCAHGQCPLCTWTVHPST